MLAQVLSIDILNKGFFAIAFTRVCEKTDNDQATLKCQCEKRKKERERRWNRGRIITKIVSERLT